MDYKQRALSEAEQILLENQNLEKIIRSSYDTLFGYLQSISDVYARAVMARHLDNLYQNAMSSIPDSPEESAESADLKTTSAKEPTGASTASSDTPSGSSAGASSREVSSCRHEEVERSTHTGTFICRICKKDLGFTTRDPSYSPGDEDAGHR